MTTMRDAVFCLRTNAREPQILLRVFIFVLRHAFRGTVDNAEVTYRLEFLLRSGPLRLRIRTTILHCARTT